MLQRLVLLKIWWIESWELKMEQREGKFVYPFDPFENIMHLKSPIITGNDQVIRILKIAELHAASDSPVLITGETGTGKAIVKIALKIRNGETQPRVPKNSSWFIL